MAEECFSGMEAQKQFASLKKAGKTASLPLIAGRYLYLEIREKYAEDATDTQRVKQEMRAMYQALRSYVAKDAVQFLQTKAPLDYRLVRMMPDNLLAIDIQNCANAVIYDEKNDDGFHQILAFDAKPLEDCRQGNLAKAKSFCETASPEQLAPMLREVFCRLRSPKEKALFTLLLGCPMVNWVNSLAVMEIEKPPADSLTSRKALTELRTLEKWSYSPASYFQRRDNPLWKQLWESKGIIDLPPVADIPTTITTNNATANHLKNPGHDQKALRLMEDLENNPQGIDKWLALGEVLTECGQQREALVAFLQATRQSPNAVKAWQHIQKLCHHFGLTTNAKGLNWWLQMWRLKNGEITLPSPTAKSQ